MYLGLASKASKKQFLREYMKDVRISKRLSEKWGKEFPTSYQIKMQRRIDKASRKEHG